MFDTYDTKYGKVTLYKNELFINATFKQGDYWEERELLNVRRYIDPARNILEIGGHCGTSSIVYASYLHSNSKHYVFEPQKRMFDLLTYNINQNNLGGKVVAYNRGLFCFKGTANMNAIDLDGGGGIVEKRYTTENNLMCNFGGICLGANGEPVDLTTIDDLLNDGIIDNIGFIHCDAQGSEAFIFSKAIECIKKFRPVILYENNAGCGNILYNNVCRTYPQYENNAKFDLKAFCLSLGYRTVIDNFESIDTLLVP